MSEKYQTIVIERETGVSRYKILKKPGRVDTFVSKLGRATKPPRTGAQKFAALRGSQMRTYASPAERARVSAEFIQEDDSNEKED